MIPRITRGSSARAALAYDFGPGRREEHVNARTVAGNVPGTWRDQAQMIAETVAARPRVEKGIWRTSLRAAPEDRVLSDEDWGRIATGYISSMGLEQHPWTATRHGDDHVHLTVSRVSWSGKVASLSHDFAKAQTACRAIEVEHQLVDASARFDRDRPQISHGERERSARLAAVQTPGGEPGSKAEQGRRAARLGVPGQLVPGGEKEQLRELVSHATTLAAATQSGREGFEEWLTRSGVAFRANVASTGRVSGYSYGLPGHVDASGEQVFFKGSQLGKTHSWAATSAKLQVIADHHPDNPGRSTVQRAAGSAAALGEPVQQPAEKPAGKPAVQVDREQMLAEHRAVLAQRQQLTREWVSADSAHRGSLAALAAARRVLEDATRSQRDASSQWEQLARQVARTAVIVAEAIAAQREISAVRRAREQLAAPFTALGGRPSAAAQRAAALEAAQRADEVARARELVGRERLATADGALQVAQQQVAAAQGEVERTGPVAVEAGVRQRRAAQLAAWEVDQARQERPSRLVQEALARARGRGLGPGHLDPWRQPPGQGRGPGLGR